WIETLTHDETVPDRVRSRPAYAGLLPAYMLGGTLAALGAGRWGLDVVHVHWPFPHAWFGAVARAMSRPTTALVASFYSVELRWIERSMPALTPLLRWTIETADGVTAISTSTADAVRRYTERDVRVIPFAAAAGERGASERMSRTARGVDDTLEILFVGRLVERKGVEVLVRAVEELRDTVDARLTVIGEGPWLTRIRDAAATLEVDGHIRFLGRVDEKTLGEAYEAADVFVLPAVVDAKGDTEGLGVVLLEALQAGVPVVASDAGGIPDIVHDGETGWLVPSGDARALARALAEVAADPAEAACRVERGRRLVETRFSVDGIVAALSECYEDARSRRSGRSGRGGGRA
ncbi:MAG: glycosyltransferase family 4 protein, partial [Gemmatimonadota bacterium]